MTKKTVPAFTLDDLGDIVTIGEAAAALRVTTSLIKQAIRAGDLAAFIPGKKPDAHGRYMSPGRGQQYRVRKSDLQAWYFGQTDA